MWYLLVFWQLSAYGSNGGVSTTFQTIEFFSESSCHEAAKTAGRSTENSLKGNFTFVCVKK